MSDELNSQLSAFVDDELTPEESELFVRRLCRDETLRHTAACYGIIGDALRGESAVTAPGDFAPRVMMALEGQTAPVLPEQALTPPGGSLRHWGFALAASVVLAVVALVTLPSRGPDGLDTITADIDGPASTLLAQDSVPVAPVAVTTQAASFGPPLSAAAMDEFNVPRFAPATTENRVRLNNMLIQHYSTGRQGLVGFRNVGFVTETER